MITLLNDHHLFNYLLLHLGIILSLCLLHHYTPLRHVSIGPLLICGLGRRLILLVGVVVSHEVLQLLDMLFEAGLFQGLIYILLGHFFATGFLSYVVGY